LRISWIICAMREAQRRSRKALFAGLPKLKTPDHLGHATTQPSIMEAASRNTTCNVRHAMGTQITRAPLTMGLIMELTAISAAGNARSMRV